MFTLVLSAVAAATTVVLAVLTYWLTVETRLLRKAGTDPALSMHIECGERHVNAIFLVIQNHGRGTAYNVKWKVTPDAGTLVAHGVELRSLKLLNGLSQIAPGQRIETFFGMAFGMLAGEGCPPIMIEATYHDAHKAELSDSFVLAPKQFEGLTRLGQSIGEDVSESLKKLVKIMDNVTSEGRLHVAAAPEHPQSSRARRVRMTVGDDAGDETSPAALPVGAVTPTSDLPKNEVPKSEVPNSEVPKSEPREASEEKQAS
jgi:hypothetical protein